MAFCPIWHPIIIELSIKWLHVKWLLNTCNNKARRSSGCKQNGRGDYSWYSMVQYVQKLADMGAQCLYISVYLYGCIVHSYNGAFELTAVSRYNGAFELTAVSHYNGAFELTAVSRFLDANSKMLFDTRSIDGSYW